MEQQNLFSSDPNALNKYFLSKVSNTKQPQLEEMFKALGGFTQLFDPEIFSKIYGEPVKGEITAEKIAYAINRYRDEKQPEWVLCDDKGFLSINPRYIIDPNFLNTHSNEKRPIFELKDYLYRLEDEIEDKKEQITSKIKQGIKRIPFVKEYPDYQLQTLLERFCCLVNIQLGLNNAQKKLIEVESIDYQNHIRTLNNYFPSVKVAIDQAVLGLHQIGLKNFDEMALEGYILHLEKFVSHLDGFGHQVNLNLEPFHQMKQQGESHFKWFKEFNRQFKKLETLSHILPKTMLNDLQAMQESLNQRNANLFGSMVFQKDRIAFHESLNNPEREIKSLIERQKKLIQHRIDDLKIQKEHVRKGKEQLSRREKEYEKLMTQTGEGIPFLQVRKASFERLLKKISPMQLHRFVEHSVEIATREGTISDHRVISQFAHTHYLTPKTRLAQNIENEIVNCEVKLIEIQLKEKTQELTHFILSLPNWKEEDCLKFTESLKNQSDSMKQFEQSITQKKSHLAIELKLASYWQVYTWCQQFLALKQNLIHLKEYAPQDTPVGELNTWVKEFEALHSEIESSDPDQFLSNKIGTQPISAKNYQLLSKVLASIKNEFEGLPSFLHQQNKVKISQQINRQDSSIYQRLRNGSTLETIHHSETVRTMRQALKSCTLNISTFKSFKATTCLYRVIDKNNVFADFNSFEIQQLQVIELLLKIEEALAFLKEFNHPVTNELKEALQLSHLELTTAYSEATSEHENALIACYQTHLTQIEALYQNTLSNPLDELNEVQKQNSNLNFWKFLMECLIQVRRSLFGKNEKEIAEEIRQQEKINAVNTVAASQSQFNCGFFQSLEAPVSNPEIETIQLDCR